MLDSAMMNSLLSASLLLHCYLLLANGQPLTPMRVLVDFEKLPESGKKIIEKHVLAGLETRSIHKITDNGLDPREPMFDDHVSIVIKPVGDAESNSYAIEIQLSIVEGASANNMLFRFRGSLASAVPVGAGATLSSTLQDVLFAILDKLMDEVKREFGSSAYRLGWHPIGAPH